MKAPKSASSPPANSTSGPKPSRLKSYAGKTASLLLTAGFFVLAGGLVWQGSGLIAQRANAVAPPDPTEAVLVRTAQIQLEDHYMVSRSFVGQIEAPQSVSIGFETAGTVSAVLFDEGERVAAGAVLARLDDRLLKADLARLEASKRALEAQRELAVLTDQRQAELRKKGFASNQAADQSRLSVVETDARIAEIDAAILGAQIRLEKATVRAPFAGRVDQRMIDPGATIGNGQPVLALVEDERAVFRVGIDPDLADTVRVGLAVELVLEGAPVRARVIAVLPKIDPVTRTRMVRAELETTHDVAFGQTGRLRLAERVAADGAWIPLDAIEDGVRGLWTVKTARTGDGDEAQAANSAEVGVEAIEILHAEEDRAFVRGTFAPQTRIVLGGLHRVAPGQRVRVEESGVATWKP